ncbi:protein kinase [Rhodococcus sp. NPDC059968]|uniref:protein kinase domain-containing protein n=1 Tax=Rhodococcus sp. NPDC059968 TaxID=3347017 RepID=UPI00366F3B9C
MSDVDPFGTQRDVVRTVAAELAAAGFDDAEEIGRGGFGVVYRCNQAALDRTVAVKVLTADLDDENRERFVREQHAMGRLTGHPNIVGALQVGTTESGRPFIVMQYLPQGSLDAWIRRHGPLPLDEAIRLGVKLSGALETAHQLGVLHRDVKPANILLTEYGEPALTDFGIARIIGGFETGTGVVTGSPAFTAPEVLAGESPSAAADVYGLGATLFCAITGHAAFERRSGEQLVAQFVRITTDAVPDLREHGFTEDVAAVVGRAMSRTAAERQPTAAALGDELRSVEMRIGLPLDDMALHTPPRTKPDAPESRARMRQSSSDPAAGRRRTGNLPLELTTFVGRRRELDEARKLLSGSRLVTLTGAGGVGKTRLALRVAARVQRDFADGAWLIELGDVSDESLLLDVVAGSLRLHDRSSRPLQDTVREFLAPREVLLILDNCEQIIDAVAALGATLLRSCPRLRILATSREGLGIGGETTLRVPPLVVPDSARPPGLQGLPSYDAVKLFTDRAVAAVPTFALAEENSGAVAHICQRLDGLPLAIELAAARLRVMSPEQILQRLTDRFAVLVRGARDLPSRQQTLQLCVDWSYHLCTPPEQKAWCRLSVFVGTFEIDAVDAVCAHDLAASDPLELVTSLVDKSILVREEANGIVLFRLLETLRDYGRVQLQRNDEYPELRRRHRDWYQQLVLDAEAGWISPQQLAWISRFKREQSNLRDAMGFSLSEPDSRGIGAGLQIATGMYMLWGTQGLLTEGRRWLDQLLARQTDRFTIERVKALYVASVLAEQQGDIEIGASLVEEARTLGEQLNDPLATAIIAHATGLLAMFSGKLEQAFSEIDSALAVFRARDELTLLLEGLLMVGLVRDLLGETAHAITYYETALEITERREEVVYRSYTFWALGVAKWRQDNRDAATGFLTQGLRLAKRVDDPIISSICLEALAWLAGTEGNARRAVVLMGAAENVVRGVGTSSAYVPNLAIYHEECVRASRHALGDRVFESGMREGRALDLDAAIGYALGDQGARAPSPANPSSILTKRERQVAELIADGLTNKAIAARLVISQRTAQGHVEHILAKLGFTSRVQVVAWVLEHNR